ncbi:hypothetical protein LJR118_000280 [Acidovorax sp. LjRoot118]|uniref:hypothetical protein n=1 Tax=Acidovorax sp. LjRoot118 TaxID=3342256 RepID=UPI003ED11E64
MAVQLLSKAAYARHRGCDEKAVRKAISEGRISTIDGKIDPEVADIQWAKNTRARADSKRSGAANSDGEGVGRVQGEIATGGPAGPDAGTASPGYTDYRTIREKADAEMAQRANLKDAGLLVERTRVERGTFDVVRAFRDAVMTIAQRAAPRCIGLGDARDIEHVIAEETRKALQGFEERLQGMLPPKDAA